MMSAQIVRGHSPRSFSKAPISLPNMPPIFLKFLFSQAIFSFTPFKDILYGFPHPNPQ